MPLRTTPTNRKTYKTGEKETGNGITYLYWKKYPKKKEPDPETVHQKQIWLAGTSVNSDWKVIEHHKPGKPGWPEGGYTVKSLREGHKTHAFYDEIILHPDQK